MTVNVTNDGTRLSADMVDTGSYDPNDRPITTLVCLDQNSCANGILFDCNDIGDVEPLLLSVSNGVKTSFCDFTATIEAGADGTLTCPPNRTFEIGACDNLIDDGFRVDELPSCDAVLEYFVISPEGVVDTVDAPGNEGIDEYNFSVGESTVIYQASYLDEDEFEATQSCSFTVTLNRRDGSNELRCPSDVNIFVPRDDVVDPCELFVEDSPIAENRANLDPSSGICGDLSYSIVTPELGAEPVTGTGELQSFSFPEGISTVTYTLEALPGEPIRTCSFTVEVELQGGSDAPTITCPTGVTEIELYQGISDEEILEQIDYVATDECIVVEIEIQDLDRGCNDIGRTQSNVRLRAYDNDGRDDFCSLSITTSSIRDITCPADVVVDIDAGCTGIVDPELMLPLELPVCPLDYTYSVRDNEGAQVASGTGNLPELTLAAGGYGANYSYVDRSGPIDVIATCHFNILMRPQDGPTAVCQDVTVNLSALDDTTPALIGVNSTASCGQNLNFSINRELDCNLIGMNPVFLTVEDEVGQQAFCLANLTVVDDVPPTITACPANRTIAVDGNCEITIPDLTGELMATTDCGNLTVSQLPEAGTTASLDDGSTVSVDVVVFDDSGLTGTPPCTVILTLGDVDPPTAICQDVTVDLDTNGAGSLSVNDVDNGSLDDCGAVTLSFEANATVTSLDLGCDDVGFFSQTLYVTDESGNQSNCTASITVRDLIAPTARCVTGLSVNLSDGILFGTQVDNGSTDNCTANEDLSFFLLAASVGGAPLGSSTPLTCSQVGDFELTLEVSDENGQTSSCNTTVVVVDDTAPTAVCQNITVYVDGGGNATVSTADVDGGSSDNCGSLEYSFAPASAQNTVSFGCDELGSQSVTLYVSDPSNNQSNCVANVMVRDTVSPVANCQGGLVELDDDGNGSLLAADLDNVSSDNCGVDFLSFDAAGTIVSKDYDCENVGDINDVVYVTDVNGNVSAPCPVIITVRDDILPEVSCNDITVYLDENGAASIVPADVGTATDNCTVTSTGLDRMDFGCADARLTLPVEFTAEDPSGNENSCIAQVMVRDTTPPTLVCKNDTVRIGTFGPDNIFMDLQDTYSVDNAIVSLSDNCDEFPGISPFFIDFEDCSDLGVRTVTITAEDDSDNVSQCTFELLVQEVSQPEARCRPVTVTLDANGGGTLSVNDVDNGSSDFCGVIDLSFDPESSVTVLTYDCSEVGTFPVTLYVTDPSENQSSCVANVTVEDVTPPVASCPPSAVVRTFDVPDGGSLVLPAAQLDFGSGASDNCSPLTFSYDEAATELSRTYTCEDLGIYEIELFVTDVGGNTSSCTSRIRIASDVRLTCSQDITVFLSQETITVEEFFTDATDSCFPDEDLVVCVDQLGVPGTQFCDERPLSCDDLGTSLYRVNATNVNNDQANCILNLTVVDDITLVANCREQVTVLLDENGLGTLTVDEVDNGSTAPCPGPSFSFDPQTPVNSLEYGCGDVGELLEVTLFIRDEAGNQTGCGASVTVIDEVPPVALCQDITVSLDENGNGTALPGEVDNNSTDACGINNVVFTSNPADAANQFAELTYGCEEVGVNEVVLLVFDNNGNSSSCIATVTVVDEVPPMAICQNITVSLDENGNGVATPDEVNNGSNDNCGIDRVVFTSNPADEANQFTELAFGCAEVGTNEVVLLVFDNNGNSSSCTATVTVVDEVLPVARCQELTVMLDASGDGRTSAGAVDNGSTDACGIASLELSQTDFSCDDVGAVDVVLTVTDVNDNVNTCTAVVTVGDEIPPVITTTPRTVILDENGVATLSVNDIASATDACGVASLTAEGIAGPIQNLEITDGGTVLNFGCEDIGLNVILVTATDVNGNVSTAEVNVTVDFVQPLLSCISELTVALNANCQAQLLPSMVLTGQRVCLSAFEFEIVVQDDDPSNGPIIDGCGRFAYTIESVGTGALELDFPGCWGFVTALDRTPPAVVETPDDEVLLCTDLGAITLTALAANVSRCWVVERNEAGDFETIASTMAPALRDRLDLIAEGEGTPVVPSFSDGCAPRLQVCVNDVATFGDDPDCDEVLITRTFIATEMSDCAGSNDPAITSFEIRFVRPTLDDIEPTGNVLAAATFECDEDIALDANGNPLPRTSDLPFFTFGDRTIPLVVNETVCNLGLTYVDGPAIMNCPNSYTFVRVYTVLDWCAPGPPLTYTQVVKVEDTTAPVFTAPTQDRDFDGVIDDGPLEFGTNIGDECAAFIRLDDPSIVLTDNCSAGIELKADIYPFQNLNGAPIGTFFLDLDDGDAELAGPIPAGTHTLRYTYTDDCGNSDFTDVTFTVVDRTAPVAICEDGLNVSLTAGSSNGGPSTGSVVLTPEMLDNGSYDDCSEVTLRIGRVRQLVDGTYELLPGASYEEELLLTCADIGNVLVGLEVSDAEGNVNYCWLEVLVEDKARPVCFAPAPVNISCIAYNAELPADINEATDEELDAAFGAATGIDNCEVTITQTISGDVNSCGVGQFTRVFTATDGQGLTNAAACTQRITVYGIHDYTLTFPLDAEADCAEVPVYDSIGIAGRACDLFTINSTVDTFRTTGTAPEECFKLEVTYDIINWCEYNSIGQAYLIPRDREGDRNPETELMYLHVRPWEDVTTTADDIAWLSKFADLNYNPGFPQVDILLDNGDDNDGDDDDNGNDNIDSDEYAQDASRGFFRYVQFIKIYDEVEPVVNVMEPTECFTGISPDNCVAEVTLTFEAFDECSDVSVTVELDADYAGTPAAFERARFLTNSEVVANGDDTYTVRLSDVPVGNHALRIRAGDGCGNFDVDILEFCVTPDKAPTPICIQTLTVTLMPDGSGGGVAAIWATDFIASDVVDCFGNVIDEYSIYTEEEATEAGFAPAVGRLGIDLTCEDFGEDVSVRVYAIDDAGNADYCSVEVEVQVSEEDLCEERASVSGMIATQDDDAIGGVAVTLTGASNMDETVMTADNGQYEFASLEIGGDFSIFAEYDAEFDLTAVTVTDIVAITNHILGSNLLDTGYDHVAADVNMDAEVNIFDLVAMRRVILGLDAELNAEGITWRFVEGRYNLTPDNWMITFPEVYNVNNLPGNLRDGDFVGVELGNVVRPRGGRAALELKVDDAQLAAGQTHTIQIRNGELAGFQGTLELDAGLELLDVTYDGEGAMNLNRAGEGMIAVAFTGPTLISLEVRATENLQVGDVIRLTDAITYREGTAATGGAGELSLHFEGDFAPAFTQNELFQNTPNPVSETTTIRFELAQGGPATLTLRDAGGRVVLVRNLDAVAGANQLELLRSDLGSSGVLTYTLTAGEFIATKKMVVLR
ncbi:T9SS type A sorting domain-containing protein [Lewinella sp. W8]|nr:T9SS type A sorting domain-containing protein [Lewinella sp. W8]